MDFDFEPRVPSPLASFSSRRFLFVTGKGGVGKTTVSAAIGKALAAEGKRVLIAMCHTKERLSALLGSAPIGDQVTEVADNVWAVNISPEVALLEYGEMVLRVKTITNAVFGNQYIKSFFRATPGLFEWAMLGKAWFHTTEKTPRGENRFDTVIFDAPATGHGLDMLRVPRVILDVVPPGVLRRDATLAWELFSDPVRSGVVVVTLPEEMPTTETIELVSTLDSELGLTALELVVNGVMPTIFTPEERDILAKDKTRLDLDAPLREKDGAALALIAGARRAAREEVQLASIARLFSSLKTKAVFLPFLFDTASTKEGTERLAAAFRGKTMAGR